MADAFAVQDSSCNVNKSPVNTVPMHIQLHEPQGCFLAGPSAMANSSTYYIYFMETQNMCMYKF